MERFTSDRAEADNDAEAEAALTGKYNGKSGYSMLICSDETPREMAQQEFQFLQLVSVFVGAVRCGVLEVDHAQEPLAHFGRFGATYDAVIKKLVDVLRDEGIYNKEAETVRHIAGSAIQTVSNTTRLMTELADQADSHSIRSLTPMPKTLRQLSP